MLAINPSGQLVTPTLSGREIPITGVIFMENIYAAKCLLMALKAVNGNKESESIDQVIDDTIKFAIK